MFCCFEREGRRWSGERQRSRARPRSPPSSSRLCRFFLLSPFPLLLSSSPPSYAVFSPSSSSSHAVSSSSQEDEKKED